MGGKQIKWGQVISLLNYTIKHHGMKTRVGVEVTPLLGKGHIETQVTRAGQGSTALVSVNHCNQRIGAQ
jgi:hypothetical protein